LKFLLSALEEDFFLFWVGLDVRFNVSEVVDVDEFLASVIGFLGVAVFLAVLLVLAPLISLFGPKRLIRLRFRGRCFARRSHR
jgi:hypothetical protein